MHASMSVWPSSWKVSTKDAGTPRTSRKWTKKILPCSPNCRIAAGTSSVISVKLHGQNALQEEAQVVPERLLGHRSLARRRRVGEQTMVVRGDLRVTATRLRHG